MSGLPDPKGFIGLSVPGGEGFVIKEFVDKGCNALVFHAYSDLIGSSVAYKIIPNRKLAPSDNWKSEPKKANILDDPCVVRCNHLYEWADKGCVVLEYDYIEGISLRNFIKKMPHEVNVGFILDFLRVVLRLFYELKKRKMEHGDFHSGNILVRSASEYQLSPSTEFKVTDFGAGRLTDESPVLDDYDGLAKILSGLLGCVDYQAISAKEKFTFNQLNDFVLGKHLTEKDPTLDPLARNPEGLIHRLGVIDEEYVARQTATRSAALVTPFDYLSCEQIGSSSSILKALYSDKFLGLAEIEAATNVVVTGPRGCGKSTIFRSVSTKHRLQIGEFDFANDPYVGIYYHCNDLYYKFPRYRNPENEQALDIPAHYATCRILIEVLETVQQLKQRKVGGSEVDIARELWNLLPVKKPDVPNADSFGQLVSKLGEECQKAAVKARFSSDPTHKFGSYCTPDVLVSACEIIKNGVLYLQGKSFYFFVDDYSSPHISKDLQKNLNRIFMQRSATCFFKLSTESPVSFSASDIDGKNYVEGREYELLNLGLKFVQEDNSRKREFLEDIFRRRLGAVKDYPAKTIVELVGEGISQSQNSIANNIAKTEKVVWNGSATLGYLCSGDVHSIISIVKRMVDGVGGKENLNDSIPMVPIGQQNDVIRKNAGSFLHNLSNTGENGQRLVDIVSAFGNVAASYLKYKVSKNEAGHPRHQASRIEINEWPEMDKKCAQIYEELLRYSVFIEDPRGKSIRGAVVPRLYLRRFLIPHFNLTFSLRDSVRMNPDEFSSFLLDPSGFEKKKRLRKESDVDDHVNQGTLDLGTNEK